jgi:hypothetical protein
MGHRVGGPSNHRERLAEFEPDRELVGIDVQRQPEVLDRVVEPVCGGERSSDAVVEQTRVGVVRCEVRDVGPRLVEPAVFDEPDGLPCPFEPAPIVESRAAS